MSEVAYPSYFHSFRESNPLRLFDSFQSRKQSFAIGDKVKYYEIESRTWINATVGMVCGNFLCITFGSIGNFQLRKLSSVEQENLQKVTSRNEKMSDISDSDNDSTVTELSVSMKKMSFVQKKKTFLTLENVSQKKKKNVFDFLNQETRLGWLKFEDCLSNPAVKALEFSLYYGRISKETCLYMIQGKCRFKKLCMASHDIDYCPYCEEMLPSYKVSASAHLRRCYRSFSEQESRDPSPMDSQ